MNSVYLYYVGKLWKYFSICVAGITSFSRKVIPENILLAYRKVTAGGQYQIQKLYRWRTYF